MKNVLILSISPYTLLQAKILLKDKKLDDNNIYVYHYEHSNNTIDLTEKYLCKTFNFKYIQNIGRIYNYFTKISKIKKVSLFFTKFFWKKERKKIFPELSNIDYVIMPYRPYLSDYLLVNLFTKKTQLFYVSDGYLIDHNVNFKPNFKFKYTVLENMYKYQNYNPIYCLEGLEIRMNYFGNARILSKTSFDEVSNLIRKSDYYRNNIEQLPNNSNNALFILQNLYPRFIGSYEEELNLYKKIINNFFIKNKNKKLFIKFHPRDTGKKIEMMKSYFENNKNIIFIESNTFGTLPLEVVIKDLSISTIIGFTSTSMPILNRIYININFLIYRSGIDVIDSSSQIMKKELGLEFAK